MQLVVLLLLLLLIFGGMPTWGYHDLGWGPSGIGGILLIVVIVLLLTGRMR